MRIFETFGMGLETQRPDRPFPLRPGTGFVFGADEFPVRDENDLIYMANIVWGHWFNHDVFQIFLNDLAEGDFYGG